jgi:hypothetical protein
MPDTVVFVKIFYFCISTNARSLVSPMSVGRLESNPVLVNSSVFMIMIFVLFGSRTTSVGTTLIDTSHQNEFLSSVYRRRLGTGPNK